MLQLRQFFLQLALYPDQRYVVLVACMLLLSAYLAIKVLLDNAVELDRGAFVPLADLMRSVAPWFDSECVLDLFLLHQMLLVTRSVYRGKSLFAAPVLKKFERRRCPLLVCPFCLLLLLFLDFVYSCFHPTDQASLHLILLQLDRLKACLVEVSWLQKPS